MRFGRLLRIGSLAIWLTAATYYWWTFVPPTPSHIIPLHGRSHRWSPGLGDVIVLSQTGDGEVRVTGPRGERKPASFGPLQFYDPATGKLLREVLTEDDEILAVALKPREVAIVHREGLIAAVDLSDPRKAVELEGMNANSQFVFAEGTRKVVTRAGNAATFDVATGARLDKEGHSGVRAGNLAVSEDGQRHATSDGRFVYVFDSATDKEVSRSPLTSVGRFPVLVRFSPDGKDLMVWEDAGRQLRRLTIWDSETGQKRPNQPSPSIPVGPLSRNGTWVISSENIRSPVLLLLERLPAKLTARLQRSTTFWNMMMRVDQSTVHLMILTDTLSGRTLGRYQVPTTAEWLVVLDDQRGAVAFGDLDAVHCYSVPANRDWLWLLMWGAGPVAAVWAVQFLFRRWWSRHAKSPGVATPGLRDGDQSSQITLLSR